MRFRNVLAILLIGIAAAGMAFASGNKESDDTRFYGPRGRWGAAPEISEELTRVTGQISFKDEFHPTLKSGTDEYELMVPRWAASDLDVKEGATITVEGYVASGMPCEDEDDDEIVLMVTKAEIDGKEYDLGDFRGGPMAMGRGGRRGGMMGGGPRGNDPRRR